MLKIITAIEDTVARDIVGPLMLHNHTTAAVRNWDDICRIENSKVMLHIRDHQLIQVGYFDTDSMTITPEHKVLITGETWLAAQEPK